MPLQVVYHSDPEAKSLCIGKCLSDQSLDEAWRDFAFELLSRSLADNALVVIYQSQAGVDDYEQRCAELAIPCRRISQPTLRRGRENVTYFARPIGRQQILLLAKELFGDPAWYNQGTLFFCRPLDQPVAEELGYPDWTNAVSLKCSFWDDDLLECSGSNQDLDSISVCFVELAKETGTELVPASSSDEVTHLMGWDRYRDMTFWGFLRMMWKSKRG